MSKNLIAIPLALTFVLAVLLVPAGEVAAQSQIPVEEDDLESLVACVTMGPEVWVAPLALQAELDAVTGYRSTVQPLGAVIDQLAPAVAGEDLRFEGCRPVGDAVHLLEEKGYVTEVVLDPPALPGASAALLRTR